VVSDIPKFYGLHPSAVESAIIGDFELIAYRKRLRVRREDAETIRNLAMSIVEYVLGGGGAGRVQDDGSRYSARERDRNLDDARRLGRKVALRAVERAREGKEEIIQEEIWIGAQRMKFRTSADLFKSLCPPPLPPICYEETTRKKREAENAMQE